MTDVQQVESTKTKKQKRAGKQPDQEWDRLVAQGKKLVAALHSKERELGKLADGVETKYGEESLARFAEEIDAKVATLNRCRSVYRAWKGIKAPSPKSDGVARALQAHPNRAEIIKDRPNLTVAKARTIMKDYRVAHGRQEAWQVGETRRWLGEAKKFALDAHKKYGHPAQEHLDPNILRQAVDEPDKLVATLRFGGQALNTLADEVECAFTTPPALPSPMFDDKDEAKPGDSTPDQTT